VWALGIKGFGFRVSGFGFKGVGFGGSGTRVQGVGFRVEGVGCGVWGVGFRVRGFWACLKVVPSPLFNAEVRVDGRVACGTCSKERISIERMTSDRQLQAESLERARNEGSTGPKRLPIRVDERAVPVPDAPFREPLFKVDARVLHYTPSMSTSR
jgi:hypothetical protein